MSFMSNTAQYLGAAKSLDKVSSDRLKASGLELTLRHLGEDGECIAAIQIDDESIDAIKAAVMGSIVRTLYTRRVWMLQELREIDTILNSQGDK